MLWQAFLVQYPTHWGEILDDPTSLSGDPVLPGFVLPVGELWEPPE